MTCPRVHLTLGMTSKLKRNTLPAHGPLIGYHGASREETRLLTCDPAEELRLRGLTLPLEPRTSATRKRSFVAWQSAQQGWEATHGGSEAVIFLFQLFSNHSETASPAKPQKPGPPSRNRLLAFVSLDYKHKHPSSPTEQGRLGQEGNLVMCQVLRQRRIKPKVANCKAGQGVHQQRRPS